MASLGRRKIRDMSPKHPFSGVAVVLGAPPKPKPQTPPETASPKPPDGLNDKSGSQGPENA
jgi:hypothetical protein